MKFALLIILGVFSVTAFSATSVPQYSCHVIVIAGDLPNGSAETVYQVAAESGGHGGQEHDFTFQKHKLGILSNGQWLAIVWQKDGKTIGKATAVTSDVTKAHVLIVENPENSDEHASVTCSAQ